jgi:hypothetical protein
MNKRNYTRKRRVIGGVCPCQMQSQQIMSGGYRPTSDDLEYVRKWKKGKKLGFSIIASLKAKGLIPRKNGTRRVSKKYLK